MMKDVAAGNDTMTEHAINDVSTVFLLLIASEDQMSPVIIIERFLLHPLHPRAQVIACVFARLQTAPTLVVVVSSSEAEETWSQAVFRQFKKAEVGQVSYVPDAGLSTLIDLAIDDPGLITTMLTTEEEGIAVATGAWLGGLRSVMLMQSSGVGNCINMLSLPVHTRTPLLMVVTMRGEWAEFNPWQVPMARATEAALAAIGVQTVRVDDESDIPDAVAQAAVMAYEADQQMAVLIGQKVLGEKTW